MAELIANAYDADAKNVYIIEKNNEIIVEDDGNGMSYKNGDITKYLEIARISRTSNEEATTALNRHKMGRKGVGKLAALSVSDEVYVKTVVSHTRADKDLADVLYEMLKFNNVPAKDLLYTNSDDEEARIPEVASGKSGIYDYLRGE